MTEQTNDPQPSAGFIRDIDDALSRFQHHTISNLRNDPEPLIWLHLNQTPLSADLLRQIKQYRGITMLANEFKDKLLQYLSRDEQELHPK